jgi:hypothetical protein
MAKAKKSEASDKGAKKTGGQKTAAKKPMAAGGQPLVDTGLAASNAARLLAAGLPHKAAGSAGGNAASPESAGFKNLKQNLSKPHLAGLNNLLDKSGPADNKKSNLPFGGGKQVAHNQTFGADATRSGVPRRTPG